jgi:hypothetical protein
VRRERIKSAMDLAALVVMGNLSILMPLACIPR